MYIENVDRILKNPVFRHGFFYFAVLFLVISLSCYPLQSDDLFMYLALGRNFWIHLTFPVVDPFLYTLTDYKWTVLHQWLGYLIFYATYIVGGLNLIILAKTLLVASAMALPLIKVHRPIERLVWALTVLLAIYSMAFRLMERTSMFSDFFIVVVLLILILEHDRPSRLKFVLPFLFLAWANIHPVFPIGWGLCFLFLVTHTQHRRTREYKQFALVTIASVLMCLLNPKGVEGFLYPFQFASHEGQVFRQYYFEWMPTLSPLYRFQQHTYFLIALTTLNLALLWFCRKSKLYFETLASLFFILYGFYAIRFVPTLGYALILLNVSISRKLPAIKMVTNANLFITLVFLVLGLKNIFFGYETISGHREFGLGIDPNVVPVKAAELILKTPQIGNVFNSHMFGSYLAWTWNGQRKIFYHGFVTDTNLFLNEYAQFSGDRTTFQKQVSKYKIGAFLLDRFQGNERLIQNLVQDPAWALAYKDESSLIFLPLKRND